jgi:hypothetical protein
MFADPKKVDERRLRRRIKAGAAVVLAMVAGAFLALKGESTNQEPASPSGPDARSGPGSRHAEDAAGVDATNDPVDASGDAAIDGTADAASDAMADAASDGSAALAVRDGGADAAAKAPKVDKHEHRKGMPVRDNLLE